MAMQFQETHGMDEKLTAFLEKEAVTTQSILTTKAVSGWAICAQQNTKKAEQENDRHVIKAIKEIN